MTPLLTEAAVGSVPDAATRAALLADDPLWLILLKCVVILLIGPILTIFLIVWERKAVGRMQNRPGPNRVGPGGYLQSLADAIKLPFKEQIIPDTADRKVYFLAPVVCVVPSLIALSAIPFGPVVSIFGERTVLQLLDLPVSALVILACSSIGVYGIVLAGWSSGSPYPLLGGMRSAAQVISYEIAMGLSIVAVILQAGSLNLADIVSKQQPAWFLYLVPSFVIYLISMVGETNRAPFDLPECESELVSGYLTEYSGFRYATYFLAEYINMATVSAVAVTLFLGGYHAPWPINAAIPAMDQGWWGPVWFVLKVQLLISLFVWLRGTLPRFRYDQFMNLGWKWLIPIALVWVMLISTVRIARAESWLSNPLVIGALVVAVVALFLLWWLLDREPEPLPEEPAGTFDAFAGGYPVPPMPGQRLPELADVVPSGVDAERTDA